MIYQKGEKMKQPLYKKIIQDLIHEIQQGKLSVNDKVPTEKELSETYGVSRITSKRALTELENDGVIYRVQGRGSFIKEQPKKPEQKTRILFVIPFANDLSLGNFNEGLAPIMQESNYEVVMSSSAFLLNKSADSIRNEFDGLIYYADNTEDFLETLFELSLKQFPVVLLDKKIHDLPYPSIQPDNFSGGKLATDYLIQKGHKKIAYLFGQTSHPQSVRQRYLGYISSIKEAGLAYHTPLKEDRSILNTETLNYVLEQNISAVICENDLVAISFMQQAIKKNIDIPTELSIIGFDDIQAAGLVTPSLTTVAQNFYLMGQLAGKTLLRWLTEKEISGDQQVPVELIKRDSTKRFAK